MVRMLIVLVVEGEVNVKLMMEEGGEHTQVRPTRYKCCDKLGTNAVVSDQTGNSQLRSHRVPKST